MIIYHCNQCSIQLGYLNSQGLYNVNLTGTTYTYEKFEKHTEYPTKNGMISIFSDCSYSTYRNNIITTLVSGSTMLDQKNRINIIWYTGVQNGITYLNYTPRVITDTVKVVYPYSFDYIHAFPISSEVLLNKHCKRCGKRII